MRRALTALLASGLLSACTHSLLQIGRLEVKLPPTGCIVFDKPQRIACNAPGGEPLFAVRAFAMCEEKEPKRWRLVMPDGEQGILVGGECYTVYAQDSKGERLNVEEPKAEESHSHNDRSRI